MKSLHLMWSILSSLTLVLACSSKKDSDSSKPERASKVSPGNAASKGHMKLPSNEPTYLNPVLETRFNRANALIFEGLVGLDETLSPVPRLAESWTMSKDGKVLTFRLRKDVKWSDGETFSSKDVAFTIDRIRKTRASTLWRTYFAAVDNIDTPDATTVVVSYKTPYAPALVSWTVGILPAHRFADSDFIKSEANTEPVGTGPFKLTRWEHGSRMLLSANPGWWNGSTEIGSIELRFGIEDNLRALQDGELDFAEISNISAWANEAQTPDFLDRFEQTTATESIFRLLAWNTRKAPFDDPRVRQALTHGMNRGRVVDDVLLGQATLLSAPFFPNMFGADPAIAPLSFDLQKAAALLDEAGKSLKGEQRFSLRIVTMESQRTPVNQEMFAIFKRDLQSIGVKMEVEYLDSPAEFQRRMKERDFDAAFFGWLRDIPDPDPSALLHSGQVGAGQNFAGYANPEVDAWLEKAVATADREERKALYAKVHQTLHVEMPYTVLYAPLSHYAWNRRLRGVNPADIGPQTRFPGVSRWAIREAAHTDQ
jgi:peptide/nickel transport system substrate-binding protein